MTARLRNAVLSLALICTLIAVLSVAGPGRSPDAAADSREGQAGDAQRVRAFPALAPA
jgi:hypothetical protein